MCLWSGDLIRGIRKVLTTGKSTPPVHITYLGASPTQRGVGCVPTLLLVFLLTLLYSVQDDQNGMADLSASKVDRLYTVVCVDVWRYLD